MKLTEDEQRAINEVNENLLPKFEMTKNRKMCKRCEEMFMPDGKSQKICNKCNKNINGSRKRNRSL